MEGVGCQCPNLLTNKPQKLRQPIDSKEQQQQQQQQQQVKNPWQKEFAPVRRISGTTHRPTQDTHRVERKTGDKRPKTFGTDTVTTPHPTPFDSGDATGAHLPLVPTLPLTTSKEEELSSPPTTHLHPRQHHHNGCRVKYSIRQPTEDEATSFYFPRTGVTSSLLTTPRETRK
ncbi:hypothetical protein DAPPUDRAFT_95742 [Daphnia pulex]|uniref:Uncharacterized protein n=1 Tax=Daphnia pulex TaxID=6669 RepID=E9FUL9_DAPPU|nr:hypothetical protein DAPPUDRAFT_95742 [Daphnia pulex]|eukprot:EFX88753.1 hypothetical protein DAPPUDRAFT_95742 [Daphnia pulex]